MAKITPVSTSRHRKDPDRHRRAYEEVGQLWPTNLRKHLVRAQAREAAEQQLKAVA